MLDARTAQNALEDALHDAILFALGERIKFSDIASLRAQTTQGTSGGVQFTEDTLAVIYVGGVVTAAYRWSPLSTANDDGNNVIKPNDTSANGRWVKWTSALRIAPVVNGPSYYLNELPSGPLKRVIVLDKSLTDEEIFALMNGTVPAVFIEADGDLPEEEILQTNRLWKTNFLFVISVLAQNLRGEREAAQGSSLSGDPALGANGIDGLIKSFLKGPLLNRIVPDIRDVRFGHASNSTSALAQRRVIRQRQWTVLATEQNPPAPGDEVPAEDITAQPQLTALGQQSSFDQQNFLVNGISVIVGIGLVKNIKAGSAMVGGLLVNYAGQSYNFPANRDTYRDLNPNGTLTLTSVPNGDPAPAVTPGALRVGMTSTDGSGTTFDGYIAAQKDDYNGAVFVDLDNDGS